MHTKSINKFFIFIDILNSLNWLCAWLLEKTFNQINSLLAEGMSTFDARNSSQIFNASQLSMVFGQRLIFSVALNNISSLGNSPEKNVLLKLLSLHGANLITKYESFFYQGGYMIGSNASELYQNGILNLLKDLKNEAISLIDVIALPDFALNTTLGNSDGKIYERIEADMLQKKGVFERPDWWKDLICKDYVRGKM